LGSVLHGTAANQSGCGPACGFSRQPPGFEGSTWISAWPWKICQRSGWIWSTRRGTSPELPPTHEARRPFRLPEQAPRVRTGPCFFRIIRKCCNQGASRYSSGLNQANFLLMMQADADAVLRKSGGAGRKRLKQNPCGDPGSAIFCRFLGGELLVLRDCSWAHAYFWPWKTTPILADWFPRACQPCRNSWNQVAEA